MDRLLRTVDGIIEVQLKLTSKNTSFGGQSFFGRLKSAWSNIGGLQPVSSAPETSPASAQNPEPAADKIVDLTQQPKAQVSDSPNRTSPEYWLSRADKERKLVPSDQPVVLVSFAGEDQAWIDELHAFIEPKLLELQDTNGRPYELWSFSDAKRGTNPGDEFPEVVAEKMWRCQAAILLLSETISGRNTAGRLNSHS